MRILWARCDTWRSPLNVHFNLTETETVFNYHTPARRGKSAAEPPLHLLSDSACLGCTRYRRSDTACCGCSTCLFTVKQPQSLWSQWITINTYMARRILTQRCYLQHLWALPLHNGLIDQKAVGKHSSGGGWGGCSTFCTGEPPCSTEHQQHTSKKWVITVLLILRKMHQLLKPINNRLLFSQRCGGAACSALWLTPRPCSALRPSACTRHSGIAPEGLLLPAAPAAPSHPFPFMCQHAQLQLCVML